MRRGVPRPPGMGVPCLCGQQWIPGALGPLLPFLWLALGTELAPGAACVFPVRGVEDGAEPDPCNLWAQDPSVSGQPELHLYNWVTWRGLVQETLRLEGPKGGWEDQGSQGKVRAPGRTGLLRASGSSLSPPI